MRKSAIGWAACAIMAVAVTPAQAAVIVGLYNTGVQGGGEEWSSGGGARPGNGADLHWDNSGGQGGHAFTGSPLYATWIANDDVSQWVTPSPRGDESFDPTADGAYAYSLTFDLAGFDPATASFAGRFAADNAVTSISLNGQTILGADGTFTDWTDFASVTDAFVDGLNTLTFNLANFAQANGNPTGLRVEFTSSSVDDLVGSAVPEPATWAMLLVGFGVIGTSIRRRKSHLVQFS